MKEKIESIILLSSEVLKYARELPKKNTDSIKNLFKILENFSKYKINNKDIITLSTFIDAICEIKDEIKEESFKNDFISLVNSIILQSGFKEKENNIGTREDLENKIKELEEIIQKHGLIVDEIKDVSAYYENIHENMLSLNQKIEDVEAKEKVLQEIKDYTENKIAKNNFDLLSSGFSTILIDKKSALNTQKDNLIIFGLCIIGIPILVILADIYKWKILFYPSSIVAIITIELFIIYYFKIFLQNYNELKEQILQIDNKQVLLGFISNYLKYKDSNSITDTSIEKLEEIIFSKITPDVKQNPTAPDIASIIDQVIKAIKG